MASNNTVINKLYKKNVLSYNSLKRSVDTIMQLLYYSKVPPQYNHTSTDAAQKYAKTHKKKVGMAHKNTKLGINYTVLLSHLNKVHSACKKTLAKVFK